MKRAILAIFLFAFVTFAAAQSYYSTRFPANENPISEGGNWVNGLTTGVHWGNISVSAGVAHATNRSDGCPGTPNACNDSHAALTGTWTANQAACSTVFIDPTLNRSNVYEEEIHLHRTITSGNSTGYEFNYSTQRDANNHAPYMQIVRWDGYIGGNQSFTVFNNVVNTPNPLTALVNGDMFCASAIGGTLKSWVVRAGAVVETATTPTIDTTYIGGAPGIGLYNNFYPLTDNALFGFSSFTATNIFANSCSIADITTAWANVTSATGSFGIPPGTCDWSAGFNFQAPAGSTSLTIAGAGNTTGSDSLGNPTGYNDQTTGQINSGTASIVRFNGSTAQTLLRVTGITFQFIASTSSCSIAFGGGQLTAAPTPFLRVDHTHWVAPLGGVCLAQTFNASWGVVDHNVVAVPVSTGSGSLQSVTNFWRVGAGYTGDGVAAGAYVWNQPTGFGGQGFLFFEDNFITGGYINDCSSGGKQVWRYNTIVHGIEQGHEGVGDFMGCRATEYYKNNVTCDQWNGAIGSTRAGTMLMWGNTAPTCSSAQLIGLNESRTDVGHGFAANPDWYYCGTGGAIPGPSVWDGNSLGANNASGYPCAQQPGRGQGDLILGGAFGFGAPMRANVTRQICPTASTTYDPNTKQYGTGGQAVNCPAGYTIATLGVGTGSWARDALEPVYEWMDTAPAQIGGDCNPLNCLPNRDYYQESIGQTAQTDSTHPFNGLTGDGHGTLLLRPAACNAGAGGQFGSGPPGLPGPPGVGYWDTVANTFYVCTTTGNPGTWSTYYTPYTYPHPFVSGVAPPPAPLASFSPTSISFGSLAVGVTSAPQTLTVTNLGNANLTWTNFSTTQPGGTTFNDQAGGGTCATANAAGLGPGASCTVVLTGVTNNVGLQSGTFNFPNNSTGPQTVPLSITGTGTPIVSFAPTSLNYNSVNQGSNLPLSITLTNPGNATLTWTNLSALAPYSIVSGTSTTCTFPTGSLAALASCQISVAFSPTSTGTFPGSLTLVDNAAGTPHVVPLTGIGVAIPPAGWTFASSLGGCRQSAPLVPTWCFTGDGHIYFSSCMASSCAIFRPLVAMAGG